MPPKRSDAAPVTGKRLKDSAFTNPPLDFVSVRNRNRFISSLRRGIIDGCGTAG
jgi:hypothetical protein